MNYNSLSPITVNIVSKKTNIVLGRYYCDDYELHNEYLSSDISRFTLAAIAEDNLISQGGGRREAKDRSILNIGRNERDIVKLGDYLYITKTDGSDIVPLRTNALYVGVIVSIDGRTINTRSILTLLDVDSVIGMQALAPWYRWDQLDGYNSTDLGFNTDNPAFAMMDCDTILGIIQSIEYALGQSPKLFSNIRWASYNQWYPQYQAPYANYNGFVQLYPINYAYSMSSAMNIPSYTMPVTGALSRTTPWWCNGKKLDILIDCPASYYSLGHKDPTYMFNLLNFGYWYGQVTREPRWVNDDWYTLRKSLSKEDYPATYGGLGSGSTPIAIKNLWSRLKEWYNDRHMMVVPVIYDSIDCINGITGDNGKDNSVLTNSQVRLLLRDGEAKPAGASTQMDVIYDTDPKYVNSFEHWNYQRWVHENKAFANSLIPFDSGFRRIKTDFKYDDVYSKYENVTYTPFVQPGSSKTISQIQYANIGFKIVMLEMDPGYKASSDMFLDEVHNKLYNPIPNDPAGRFNVNRNMSRGFIIQQALPRAYRKSSDGSDINQAGYKLSSAYDRFYVGDTGPNAGSSNAGPLWHGLYLIDPDQLRWHLDINENDTYIESISMNGEADKSQYDVLVYKDTIGAISCDYKQDDTEYTCLTRNDQPLDPVTTGDNARVFQSCLSVDEELPAAYYSAKDNLVTRMRGGWTQLNGFGSIFWSGSEATRRYGSHPVVTNPVIPVVVSKNNLKDTGTSGIYELAASLQPQADVPVNFEVKINNNVPSEVINKWQIRMGQSACIHMKNGMLYQNLRVLGVEINKDEDFFTISIGAKSPTIINEIERRTR